MHLRLHHLFFVTFLALILFQQGSLFLQDPLIWSDEAIYADLAINIIKENRFGVDIWGDSLVPGVQTLAAWNPPLFFFVLAGWFKLVGISIVKQRLLSVIFAGLLIIVYLIISNQLLAKKHQNWKWLAVALLLYDPFFVRAAKISRPEIFNLFFAFVGLLAFWSGWKATAKWKKNALYFMSGAGLASAFLVHPLGIMFSIGLGLFLLRQQWWRVIIKIENWILLLGFSFPILGWLTWIWPHRLTVWQQLQVASARKFSDPSWYSLFLNMQPKSLWWQQVGLLFVTGIYLFFLWTGTREKIISKPLVKQGYEFIALQLISIWIICFVGKMPWYFSLPLPFVYLATAILITETKSTWKQAQKNIASGENTTKIVGILLGFALLILLTASSYTHYKALSIFGEKKYSYQLFMQNIRKQIPENKGVLISTIPTAYYAFVDQPNDVYLFPVFNVAEEKYWQLLTNVDYVVYNGLHELAMGDYLDRYLELNVESQSTINHRDQYRAIIFKLKPAKERLRP